MSREHDKSGHRRQTQGCPHLRPQDRPGQPEFRGVQIPGQTARLRDSATNPVALKLKWFTKLDRNGDGELARREFPGSRAEFQKLDQNSDGIVDAAEAEFVK